MSRFRETETFQVFPLCTKSYCLCKIFFLTKAFVNYHFDMFKVGGCLLDKDTLWIELLTWTKNPLLQILPFI